jgi:hypothetical protein
MVRRTTETEGWKITRDRTRCERPACPLPAASSWYALLEFPDCVRRDLCDSCFAERRRRLEQGGEAGSEARRSEDAVFWRARRREGSAKRGPVLDLPALHGLFEQLGERIGDGPIDFGDGDPDALPEPRFGVADDAPSDDELDPAQRAQWAGLRYFVALLLMRKRLLKTVEPRGPVEEMADLVVVDPKDGDGKRHVLFAPPLDEGRLAGLKDELIAAIDETSGDEQDA